MRGVMGAGAGGATEARHRSAGSPNVYANKRRFQRSSDFRQSDKSTNSIFPERSSSWKLHSLKLALLIIICYTFLTLLHSPAAYHNEHALHAGSRSRFMDVGWIWAKSKPDPRYVSHLDVDWTQILECVGKLDARNLKIGLLNFNISEISQWHQLLPHAGFSVIQLDYAESNITWNVLYPEWIDEEEESQVPACPKLPKSKFSKGFRFDIIAVKLPCRSSGSWSRDVARLHLQLAAAQVAAASTGSQHPVYVHFVTNCFPIPNLFTCKNLVMRKGNNWLYKPDLHLLKQKLQLPIGSCELALPIEATERPYSNTPNREAYATILHSADVYVCGAIAAAQSIRLAGSKRDLVILVDETVSDSHKSGLEAAGWKIKTITRIRNPKAERDAYNEWNYSKFRLWQLTEYDKIIFIDADLLILRNIDFLFTMPEITATGNNVTFFNSGVMVIQPSNCTFQLLMDHINEIESYNGGDQGYLNEIFTWWHRIPRRINFLKHFWIGDEEEIKEMKTRLFGADPPILYVLHYLGLKPWLCFRDYDCNWNVDIMQEFASDIAHARWWKVHDTMPKHLQSFCLLRTKQKAALEWDRRQAEKANYSDGHWRRKITDRRLKICSEDFCYWKNMLRHWGDPNWSDENLASVPNAKLPSL
ncbi:UDP-glucuronate:xylan alpha-glucuronosyltransferase 3 [Canna indica]|uniref:Hexosyltransferase n=1 Tax=Canna indica TaxID=4628 RepID=A0AAQ3Q6Y2_9LILI|nr:UDP-glucuronate:xylan alpha-glucuronosyltransferase 3 [Canna indica]